MQDKRFGDTELKTAANKPHKWIATAKGTDPTLRTTYVNKCYLSQLGAKKVVGAIAGEIGGAIVSGIVAAAKPTSNVMAAMAGIPISSR